MDQGLKIIIEKDNIWYIASIKWYDNLFAHGMTVNEALKELINVVKMYVDELWIEKTKSLFIKELVEENAI